MADDAGKTEKPTPKRLKKARREGQVGRTADAATWLSIAAATAALPLTARSLDAQIQKIFAQVPDVGRDPSPARALEIISMLPGAVFRSCLPMCLAAALAAILATAAQGVYPTTYTLKPNFKRMNPINGLKRMVGPQGAWEALKALVKLTVIGVVVWIIGRSLIPELAGSGAQPLGTTMARAERGLNSLIWVSAFVGLLLAGADYAYQKRSTMKKLRMSIKDIKDENRQSEGDPMIKQAIRQRAMAMGRNRMLAAMVDADVVVVNPTHVAVALKYQVGRGAPRVVAKGAGKVAARIREIAAEHRVPLVEDKPLARTLYRVCELDEEIPSELYIAVARILAFVMSAGRPGRQSADRPVKAARADDVPDIPARSVLRARRAREMRESRTGDAQGPGPRRR